MFIFFVQHLTGAQSSFFSPVQPRWHLSNEGVQQECLCWINYCVHSHFFHLSLFWLSSLARSHLIITHYNWIKCTENLGPNSVPLCIGAEGLKSNTPTMQESGRPWRNHKEVHGLHQKSVLRWYIVQYPWGLGGVTCTVDLCTHGSTGQNHKGWVSVRIMEFTVPLRQWRDASRSSIAQFQVSAVNCGMMGIWGPEAERASGNCRLLEQGMVGRGQELPSLLRVRA